MSIHRQAILKLPRKAENSDFLTFKCGTATQIKHFWCRFQSKKLYYVKLFQPPPYTWAVGFDAWTLSTAAHARTNNISWQQEKIPQMAEIGCYQQPMRGAWQSLPIPQMLAQHQPPITEIYFYIISGNLLFLTHLSYKTSKKFSSYATWIVILWSYFCHHPPPNFHQG